MSTASQNTVDCVTQYARTAQAFPCGSCRTGFGSDFLFKSARIQAAHNSTRQYARLVSDWVASTGLNPADYGTHTLRRTKVSLIYRKTRNLRAVQLLLGHRKLGSTVRYLGGEVDDALEIAEHTDT